MDRQRASREQQAMVGRLEDVRQRLLSLPNVLAVGVGLKESDGEFTDEIAYRVYVRRKVDLSSLSPEDVIPREIDGFRTDVLIPLRITNDSDVCGNERETLAHQRPLRGGVAISTDSLSYGTLGWFGRLDADDTRVLLTNKHVLWDATSEVVTAAVPTAQPQLGEPSQCCCCECGSDNVIGASIIGIRDMDTFTATSVDAAIARINDGIDIDLVITNAATTEVLRPSGTNAAVVGDAVRKIGARSGFTRGTVIHIGDVAAAPADPGGGTISVITGQVLIIPIAAETYQVREGVCKFAFSNSGDSGAVILNAANEIIALNWGGDRTSYTVAVTVACNIQNVLNAFSTNGFPITLSVSPPGGGGDAGVARSAGGRGRAGPGRAAAVPAAVSAAPAVRHHPEPDAAPHDPPPNVLLRLRDANRGSLLDWLFERHHREVLHLVNHERRVTVPWRRCEGPAWVAALARAARVETYRVPAGINGITRTMLLEAMEEALHRCGSQELRADMTRFRDDVYALAAAGATIEELADALLHRGLIDAVPDDAFPATAPAVR